MGGCESREGRLGDCLLQLFSVVISFFVMSYVDLAVQERSRLMENVNDQEFVM